MAHIVIGLSLHIHSFSSSKFHLRHFNGFDRGMTGTGEQIPLRLLRVRQNGTSILSVLYVKTMSVHPCLRFSVESFVDIYDTVDNLNFGTLIDLRKYLEEGW